MMLISVINPMFSAQNDAHNNEKRYISLFRIGLITKIIPIFSVQNGAHNNDKPYILCSEWYS